ncbi:hypothetical protein PVAP13_4KG120758 [Panicum virgatum]|uniref:Secreted protein n=1 Tax=Panicum virgatum TaxID=38727 RepID=A0A8T0TDV4_PANVG|nr:hypothetical protein PVAP13_4KG120758 [Panicum virgatum]
MGAAADLFLACCLLSVFVRVCIEERIARRWSHIPYSVRLAMDRSTWQLLNCVATIATFRGSSSSSISLSRTSLTSPAYDGST